MNNYIAGLDIGTSSIAISIVDSSTSRQVEIFNVNNDSNIGGYKQNPARIRQLSLDLLNEVFAKYEITAIGITGQMHGILFVDENGCPVSPVYTWQYESPSEIVEEVKSLSLYKVYSGYGVVTMFGLNKTGEIPNGSAKICTIPDYIAMTLAGLSKPVMHSSMAASLGLFDIDANEIDIKAISRLGLESSFFPEVFSGTKILGSFRGADVLIAIGDNQASYLGSTLGRESVLCINCGTGSQVSIAVNDYHGYLCQEVRPYLEGRFLLTGSALCGGRAYAILEGFFRDYFRVLGFEERCQYDVMNRLSSMDGPILDVDTRFCGTREDPTVKGGITGLDENNFTPSALVKGVLQGIAEELHSIFLDMRLPEVNLIVGSGNCIRKSKVLVSMLSRLFEKDVESSPFHEEAAYGASFFALKGAAS